MFRSPVRLLIAFSAFLFIQTTSWATIARLDLDGAIDPITAQFVVDGIERAESEEVEFLLIRLQTPGGLGSSMEAIITKMLNSEVPIVVFVTPSGASAASAGFFVLRLYHGFIYPERRRYFFLLFGHYINIFGYFGIFLMPYIDLNKIDGPVYSGLN